jgi:RNase H-like domain found in reverse transcriptase/Integrase zinc binding domain
MDWPVPKNHKEVQAFLGFANFYRRFVKGFSHHEQPLVELTKKDSKWSWGEREQQAFDGLKQQFMSTPILLFTNDDLPYRMEADSSDVATGAVLSQKSPEDDKWHLIAFYSKSLTPVERNYEIHDKEMLAIIRALEEWRHFLEGLKHRIEIWTDHKNLEYFRTAKKLNRRQACWSLYVSRFDFELHQRLGVTMGKSDALSHCSDHGSGSDDNSDLVLLQPELFVVHTLEGLTLVGEERGILREVRKAFRSLEDEVSGAVWKWRESGGRSLVSAEWPETEGVLTFHGKVYVPDVRDLRWQVVAQHHDWQVAGHPGRWKTLELISQNYWWSHMSRYIGEYTKTCDLCLQMKARRPPPS